MPICRNAFLIDPALASLSKRDRDSMSSSSRHDAEKEHAAAVAATERLKTVIRRLPANLPEEVFWQSVQQWVTDETVLWKVFYPGKSKKKLNKENIPSRAYIAFKKEEFVAQFSRGYDGHIFRDKQGNESQAVVEFAPFQKFPPEKKKVDARNATIEKDEDYASFLASLDEAGEQEPLSIESLIAANQPPPMPKTTPLLEALKAEKFGIKDRSTIPHNHVQYKNPTILESTSIPRNLATASSAKEETSGKKKAVQPPPPPLGKDSPQPDSGKKVKKAQAAAAKQQHYQQPHHVANTSDAKKEPPFFKPHKVARQQAAAAKAAAVATQAPPQIKTEVLPVSSSSSGDGSAAVAPVTAGVAAQVTAAAAASRRGRPVVGLASRQLQAALSQVGASAVERKRREREAEKGASPASPSGVDNDIGSLIVSEGTSEKGKEPERAINTTSSSAPGTSNAAGRESRERQKHTPPISPRRDRTKKREKGGHQTDSGVKVPSIMQRPEGILPPTLQHDVPGRVLPGAVQGQAHVSVSDGPSTAASGSVSGPPSRGDSRRGRGRSRGGPIRRGG